MKLNPLDIRRQQFAKKTFGGYDTDEVDGFVRQIADQWESVLDEQRAAAERLGEAEHRLRHYERVELALQEALETVRDTGRRAEAMAEQKARLIVDEAELRARQILQDAERDRHGMRQDLVKLSSRQAEIGARLRGFLLSELEILAQFQGDDPVGFIKLQPAYPDGPPALRAVEAAPDAPRLAPHLAPHDADPADTPDAPDAVLDVAATVDAPTRDAQIPETAAPDAPLPSADDDAGGTPPVPPRAPAEAPPLVIPLPPEPLSAYGFGPRFTSPPAEPPPAPPAEPLPTTSTRTDLLAESDDLPPVAAPPAWASGSASAPAWDLRSLVTGADTTPAASEAERDRIRRILDDLD